MVFENALSPIWMPDIIFIKHKLTSFSEQTRRVQGYRREWKRIEH